MSKKNVVLDIKRDLFFGDRIMEVPAKSEIITYKAGGKEIDYKGKKPLRYDRVLD